MTRDRMQDREARRTADMAVRVFHDTAGHRAMVVDVSSGGVGLIGPHGLRAGDIVTINYLNLCIRAKVAWSDGRTSGVQFLSPITPEEIELLRGASESERDLTA